MSSEPTPTPTPGSCLCGAVRFELRAPTRVCAHCHCSMCRRAHGAAFVTWISLPRDGLHITEGEEQLTSYSSSDHGVRRFCRSCGSALFFLSQERPEAVDVCFANLDAPADRRPQLHVFHDDRVDWIETSDELPRLGGATGIEAPSGAD